MRVGQRIASLGTLHLIAQVYGPQQAPDVDNAELLLAGLLLAAASQADQGDPSEWISLLERIFDDGEPDPDADPNAPELTPLFSSV